MAAIFIAYRESDTKAWAVAVRDTLAATFGDAAVFLDKDTLVAGAWAPQLEAGIAGCSVFVLVIGRSWLDARDAGGRRRLDDAADVHRREVALALATPGVTVLPLLVDGAAAPQAEQLPAALRDLAEQQAYAWADGAGRRAVDRARLVEAIQRLTGLPATQPESRRSGWVTPLLGALALTAAAATAASMASLPLSGRELVVVLVAALAASFGARALWQRRPWRAAGGR